MKKLVVTLILVLLHSPFCLAAGEEEIQYFDRSDHLSKVAVWDLVATMCGAGIGSITKSTSLKYDENIAESEMKWSKTFYEEDLILDPNFNLLFSSKHSFDEKSTEQVVASSKDNSKSVKIIVEKYGLESEEAKSLSECIKEMGNLLAEYSVGSDQKMLLQQDLQPNQGENIQLASFTLRGLDHSIVDVYLPSKIKAGDIVPIQIVVTPSVRFQLDFPGDLPTKLPSKELLEQRLESVEFSELSAVVGRLIGLAELKLSKEEAKAGFLTKKTNSFGVLSLTIKEKKLNVTPITPLQQPLNGLVPTRWLVEMEPKTHGSHSLYIEFKAENNDPRDSFYLLHPLEIKIEFSLLHSLSSFISRYWQWILGTILIPFLVYSMNRNRTPQQK